MTQEQTFDELYFAEKSLNNEFWDKLDMKLNLELWDKFYDELLDELRINLSSELSNELDKWNK